MCQTCEPTRVNIFYTNGDTVFILKIIIFKSMIEKDLNRCLLRRISSSFDIV